MSLNLFKVGFYRYMKRMLRDPFSMGIFVVLPVILVYILSTIYTHGYEENFYFNGYNMVATHIAIGMTVLFQLNGGIYLLHFLNVDLVSPMKWRLRVSPCPTYTLIFSAIAACLIFTFSQGILIVVITSFLLDVYWGNIIVALAVIFLTSIISMLINILVFFFISELNTAEYISWGITSAMSVLGGFVFPLPNNNFFRFMSQYGTPFSLARSAILESGFLAEFSIENSTSVYVYILLLAGIVLMLSAVVIPLSRRRLA